MDDDVIDLLKAHEYFRGISGAILGEIASFAKVTNYDAAAVIHQLNDSLTSICFIPYRSRKFGVKSKIALSCGDE